MSLNLVDIKTFAIGRFPKANSSHDWEHTLRVYNICRHIGRVERADMEVLEVAAYLHDIGRPIQEQSRGVICHAEKGAEMASDFLAKALISSGQRSNIIHCIRSHRFRGNCIPETLEAKVLFDADKLDAIGAIGIGRAFQFAGEIGAKFHNPDVNPEETKPYTKEDTGYREYSLKLRKIKERMLTVEGRCMAEARHEFMEIYFKRFLREYEGLL